ncbi:hypothetical protein [Terrihalobacillus insolitus]|uniref:hypothetical protein n=1 Tax=Terrihalobacillus insolitus TaxID=2950438 RepID=UPI00233F893E|nr:hypothetical protein [Terrihalobacillus insolitus]MDC3413920.1 hypothetical protein [Terrihalobacillus insolitus]
MKIQALMNKHFYDGIFIGNYKVRLEREVTKLLATLDDEGNPPTIEDRKKLIDALFDAYIDQTGEVPDGVQVQRLGNWLLLEEMKNNHPDKVTRQEYPFMTKRQLRTRYRRERADEQIPETHTKQKYLGGRKQSNYIKAE